MEARIEVIKQKLNSKFYHMNDTWLNDCLDYYLEENPNATDEETLTFVTAQWQLSDLREISNEKGCLPRNIAQQKSTTLPGKYILQVEKGYDISTPKYKQLETMRKVTNDNVRVTEQDEDKPWEIKGKRMMQLFLTDGIQDISAIEYTPIRFLKDVILPGFKIMIKGPVSCRRGIILIEEGNISEIGGEVENLLITNATENVFARALNMPENPDPYNDTKHQNNDVALLDDDFDIDFDEITELESKSVGNRDRNPSNSSRQKKSSTLDTNNTRGKNLMTPIDKQKPPDVPVCFQVQAEVDDIEFPDDDDLLFDLINEDGIDNNSREVKAPQEAPKFSNEDLIIISDEEEEIKTSMSIKKNTIAIEKLKSKEKIDEQLEDFGSMDWEDFELEAEALKAIQEPIINKKNQAEVKSVKTDISMIFKKKSEASGNIPKSSVLKPMMAGSPLKLKSSDNRGNGGSGSGGQKRPADTLSLPAGSRILPNKNPSKNNPNPSGKGILDYFKKTDKSPTPRKIPKICDFICDLKRLSLTEEVIRRKIWGNMKYLGKLRKGEAGWALEGTISDGTESLDVEFASEVLEKELGYTVSEFAVQKKQRKNNPELDQKLRTAFRIADAKLKGLDGLVEIEFSLNKKPRVISIRDLSDSERKDITECKKRLGY